MAKQKTILVIEDEEPIREAVEAKLSLLGMKVISSKSVKDALRKLKNQNHLDLVWLDHYLVGEETGISFVESIRKIPNFLKVPIFLISNTASHEKIHKYKKLGVNKCYVKSNVRLDEIIEDIKSEIGLHLSN